MSRRDLDKETLYEGVKQLVECEQPHIHLCQQKLYTLFSLGFQYMLYRSTKQPGHYIIRVEDSFLLEKLQRKSKDQITRNFLQKLALPRRFKYDNSCFHLDFFNFSTWNMTNDLPKDKIMGALIVKNTNKTPVELMSAEDEEQARILSQLPKNYFLTSLQDIVPKTITIAYGEDFEGLEPVSFPFIKEEPSEKVVRGVKIYSDINLEDIED